jgi:hypothetical protein
VGRGSIQVEALISHSPSLSLCADLANGSKHLRLTRARVDPSTDVGRRHFHLMLGGGAAKNCCEIRS